MSLARCADGRESELPAAMPGNPGIWMLAPQVSIAAAARTWARRMGEAGSALAGVAKQCSTELRRRQEEPGLRSANLILLFLSFTSQIVCCLARYSIQRRLVTQSNEDSSVPPSSSTPNV